MATWLLRVDEVLRRRHFATDDRRPVATVARLSMMIILFGMLYGAAMGSFNGLAADRLLQVTYSAIKVPLLLLATFAISLPSFYVLNMLFGLAGDFRVVVRAVGNASRFDHRACFFGSLHRALVCVFSRLFIGGLDECRDVWRSEPRGPGPPTPVLSPVD